MSVIPGQAPPLTDPGNPLLVSGLPAVLQTGIAPTADGGQAGIVTIRTPDVTLSVTLDRAGAAEWVRLLTQLRDSLSGTRLIAAGPHVPVAGLRP